MKKKIIALAFVMLLLVACGPATKSNADKSDKIKVAVAILPLKDLVEKIGEDKVEVVVAIPKGASPANYEPTPQQIKALVESQIYFSLDMPAEKGNILPKLEDEDINIVRLDEIVDEKYPPRLFDEEHGNKEDSESKDGHKHNGRDPHIWVSPKRAKYILGALAENLSELAPEHKGEFMKNYELYFEEISKIDEEISKELNQKSFSFIVFHPSLGYFADDYSLEMISIEESGKRVNANHIKEVIDLGREKNIKKVLYQYEFYSQSAEQIANELGADAIGYTVLWEDYLEGLKELKEILKQ